MSEQECTCTVTGPNPDDTTFDEACPFHGKGGSMVVQVHASKDIPNPGWPSAATDHPDADRIALETEALAALPAPAPPLTETLDEWVDQEVGLTYMRNRERFGEMERLRKNKPKGYLAKIVNIEKDVSAAIGRRVAIEELRQLIEQGRVTVPPKPTVEAD